jgi:quercetin dioxygenase-like cupin family protein
MLVTDQSTVPAPPAVPVWTSHAELRPFTVAPGISMRALVGTAAMMNWVTLEPGAVVPTHSHPNEQLGLVLEGAMELTIGDETRVLGPGDAYLAPPDVPHMATAQADGCLVLDVFAPPRADYAARAAEAAAGG